jgi:hypothetical protein
MPKAEVPKIKSLRDFLLMMEAPETIRAQLGTPIGTAESTNDAWSVLANESSVSAQEIFRKLESLGLDGVWRSVSAYTKKVDSLTVEASVGFDISTPIAEVGLEVSAGLTLGKSYTELNLILQLPSEINLSFYSPSGLLFNSHAWYDWPLTITNPILLSKLSGGGVVVKGNISAKAGFSFSIPLPPAAKDKLGEIFSQILSSPKASNIAPYEDKFYSAMDEVSLSIELEANFSIGCNFDYLYLTDLQPSQYLNTRSSEFQTELESNIGIGRRNAELKAIHTEILNYYKSKPEYKTNQEVLSIIRLANSLEVLPFESISITNTVELIKKAYFFEHSEVVKNQDWINKLINFYTNIQLVVSALIKHNYDVPLEKLLSRFNLMGFQNTAFVNDQSIAGSICNSGPEELKIKTSNYSSPFIINITTGTFGVKKTYITIEGNPETKLKDVRFLPTNSFIAKVRGGQNSNSNTQTSLSYYSSQPNAEASLGAKALSLGASVSATAKVKFSKYRFQTSFLTSGLSPGILTQDTRVRYTQMLANFEASAGIRGTEAEKVYQSISYKSANLLWCKENLLPYDSGFANWGTSLFTKALPGSGLSYGSSISLNSLNKLMNSNPADISFKNSLCNELKIEQHDLELFISGLALSGLVNQLIENSQLSNQGTNMFLIESSIAIIGGYAGVKKKEEPEIEPTITLTKNLFDNFEELYLQQNLYNLSDFLNDQYNTQASVWGNEMGADIGTPPIFFVKNIYLRQRNADVLNLKDKTYKLGTIPLGVVNLGISYNTSLDVGAQGVTTLFEFDVFNAKYADNPNFLSHYNFQVPPSTLFFQ